jgi:hypothetical protein
MEKKLLFVHKTIDISLIKEVSPTLFSTQEEEMHSLFQRIVRKQVLFSGTIPYNRINKPSHRQTIINRPLPSQRRKISFDEATDMRADQIAACVSEDTNLPIYIYWSGGIDSTVILSAIIKHWPDHLKERVVVKMNYSSRLENPFFYKNYIENKFKVENTHIKHKLSEGYTLHGDPADALWIQGNIVTMSWQHGLDFCNDDIRNPSNSILANMITTAIGVDDFNKLHELVFADSRAADVELKSTSDFFWWLNFNFQYETMITKHIADSLDVSSSQITTFDKSMLCWYDSNEYQEWSISAQASSEKFDGSITSYKMPAKKYIYDLDENVHSLIYKSKMRSPYTIDPSDTNLKTLVFDDGSAYYWERTDDGGGIIRPIHE